MRHFIFGAGFSGRAFGRRMQGRGAKVWGTTRSQEKFARLRETGIEPLPFDGRQLPPETASALAGATHLVISAAPGPAGDPVIAAAGDAIRAMPDLRWIGYLSTVGVYGDHGGAWVDEEADCRPSAQRSAARIEAERAWTSLGAARDVPVAILRLSGIYGPGRNAFVNLEKGTARRVVRDGQVFNRIHVEDIAGAIEHLGRRELGGVYNVSDDEPSPPQDVVAFAAALMGVPPPPETTFEDADMTPMARSFWGENKRVSNARIRRTGFDFAYPDYRSALTRMWSEASWRSSDEPAGEA